MIRPGAALLALALSACAGKTPPVIHYDLAGPTQGETQPAPPGAPVIALERVASAAPYDTNRIALRTSDVNLDYYRYHRWVAPAPDLVTELLASNLRESGQFSRVEIETFGTEPAAILEGRLLTLEIDATQPRLTVHIVVELTAREPGGDVLFHRQLSRRIPLATRSVEAAVAAMRRGLQAIAQTAARQVALVAARAPIDEPQ